MNNFDLSSRFLASMLCDGVMKSLREEITTRLHDVANTVVEDAARKIMENLKGTLVSARTMGPEDILHVTLKINDKNIPLGE